jgi:hypothetical protein
MQLFWRRENKGKKPGKLTSMSLGLSFMSRPHRRRNRSVSWLTNQRLNETQFYRTSFVTFYQCSGSALICLHPVRIRTPWNGQNLTLVYTNSGPCFGSFKLSENTQNRDWNIGTEEFKKGSFTLLGRQSLDPNARQHWRNCRTRNTAFVLIQKR